MPSDSYIFGPKSKEQFDIMNGFKALDLMYCVCFGITLIQAATNIYKSFD